MAKRSADEGSRMDGARARLTSFSDRFKLGKHYTIERFGVIMSSLMVTGVMVIGMVSCGALRSGNEILGSVALYTAEFTSSRTGVIGTVDPVYVNQARNRALVMMKFDDPTQMSSNAEDYYVYGVGVDDGSPTRPKNPLVGAVYSFANTGYLGVIIEAPEGFPQQIINLTVRAENELMTPVEDPELTAGLDPSFTEHDQWRVMINPAASEARWLTALDSEELPTAERLYADAVLWPQEQEHRRKLDGVMADLNTYLRRMQNFTAEMASTSVAVGSDRNVRLLPPTLPPEISGDEIEGMSSTELREALATMPVMDIEAIAAKTERARLLDSFEDGYMPNTYVINGRQRMPGGTDFDWRNRSVSEGYFSTLGASEDSIAEYLEKLSTEPSLSYSARTAEWALSNGDDVSDLPAGDMSVRPLLELRNNAVDAYDSYFTLKRQYQAVDLPALLIMEQTLAAVAEGATRASGPQAVEFRS